ncbi:MAG: alpha-amylase family protein [Propionibacteriaceae bacterium]|jgi:glycosidase|nr:alpha-amylase family protein [Propionibacteriaceae bacterium]
MGWAEHAIWWHVYPLGFCGAPIREADPQPAPRLRRLLNWLDYAVKLGASGLLLGPIFASRSHGYDTRDYYRIDPRLGGRDDFDDLVAACKQRGLRIVLDGVFSHASSDYPDLARVLREGPGADGADLFDIDWEAPGGPAPRVFEGHGGLARFNHASPSAVAHVAGVMNYWLDRGIDGWRLDAAYSVPRRFWAQVLPRVREGHPDAWILGEVIHGDYAGFVAETGVDAVTQYELWKAIWSSVREGNPWELKWALARHDEMLKSFTPNIFVGNHDVTRIASTLGQGRALIALAILMTLGGVPSVYYGDEQGYTGVKQERVGGDDDVRPAFPDTPEELSKLGEGVFRAHQDLIGLRRRHPWLTTASTAMTQLEYRHARYRSSSPDGQAIDVELDFRDQARVVVQEACGQVLWQHRAD